MENQIIENGQSLASGEIVKISGPLIVARMSENVKMFDVVHVSEHKLIGEVLEKRGDLVSIQVYEQTAGLSVGEKVVSTGAPLSVELAPGLIESIYDGIQRPLESIRALMGDRIQRGADVPKINREKKWSFTPIAKVGESVQAGDVIGTVQETPAVLHSVMVPLGVSGELSWVFQGEATILEPIAKIVTTEGKEVEIPMLQKWPVRKGRPYAQKLPPDEPMVTGQRVIDTLFPIAKGGTAAIPGPFGSGKTVVQHQLAKWADADIIVYVGCGERGNEMTDVLREFPELNDPRTGLSLMKRTVLIANTSDMPVAAREASIYTGITIAEYFRDMGYKVAIMADSTSRWAEALREMSGRLEEMPGEEGYPAYLGSRLAEYYERAGYVTCLGSEKRTGAVTAVGAVSPPGGDISEPVSQATLRIVKVFWCLSAQLAYRRHFPAIDWLQSYSLYTERLNEFFIESVSSDWPTLRLRTMTILQKENELEEIVRLVGADALALSDRMLLEVARSIREDYLHQIAFHEIDTHTSLNKQHKMLRSIFAWYDQGLAAIGKNVLLDDIEQMSVREQIARLKYVPEQEIQLHFDNTMRAITDEYNALIKEATQDA